jgi:hypothetical protein
MNDTLQLINQVVNRAAELAPELQRYTASEVERLHATLAALTGADTGTTESALPVRITPAVLRLVNPD